MYIYKTSAYENDKNWPALPPTIMSAVHKSVAKQIEQTIKLVNVVDSPTQYENEMVKTREKAERKLQGILLEKPELKDKTMQAMAMVNPGGQMGPYGMPPPNMMGMGMGMPPNMGMGMPFIPFPPPDVMYQYKINYLYNQLMAWKWILMVIYKKIDIYDLIYY